MSNLQQVNLYTSRFRSIEPPFSSKWLIRGAIILCLLIGLATLVLWFQETRLVAQAEVLEKSVASLTSQVEPLRTAPKPISDQRLQQQKERLTREVDRRQQILGLIAQQNLGNAKGFSSHLQALSQEHVSGVALQDFSLLDGGHYLEMQGQARPAAALPLYVQKLQNSEFLTGVKLGTLVMEQADSLRGVHQFVIRRESADE